MVNTPLSWEKKKAMLHNVFPVVVIITICGGSNLGNKKKREQEGIKNNENNDLH